MVAVVVGVVVAVVVAVGVVVAVVVGVVVGVGGAVGVVVAVVVGVVVGVGGAVGVAVGVAVGDDMIDWTKLDELHAAATPGKWVHQREAPYDDDIVGIYVPNMGPCRVVVPVADSKLPNAQLIVALHNDYPAIRDYVRALEREAKAGRALRAYHGHAPEKCLVDESHEVLDSNWCQLCNELLAYDLACDRAVKGSP